MDLELEIDKLKNTIELENKIEETKKQQALREKKLEEEEKELKKQAEELRQKMQELERKKKQSSNSSTTVINNNYNIYNTTNNNSINIIYKGKPSKEVMNSVRLTVLETIVISILIYLLCSWNSSRKNKHRRRKLIKKIMQQTETPIQKKIELQSYSNTQEETPFDTDRIDIGGSVQASEIREFVQETQEIFNEISTDYDETLSE